MKRLIPVVALLALALTTGAYAQQAVKVAVVNSQQAFETSAEGKRVAAQMQQQESKIKTEIQKMDDAIRGLENRLNTGRITMTPEALLNLQTDLEKKATDRKRFEEDSGREYQQTATNLVNRLRAEMVAIVDQIAKEKGYDLVLDLASSGVVYRNEAIDITAEVVKRYDASKASAPAKK